MNIQEKQPKRLMNIEEAITKIKMPIIISVSVSIVLNILILLTGLYFQLSEKEVKYSSLETCLYGMNSIIENSKNKDLVGGSILNDLKNKPHKFEYITLIKSLDPYTCDVFIKTNNKIRRFEVGLEKNSKFKHFYKIHNIKERKINSRYQI